MQGWSGKSKGIRVGIAPTVEKKIDKLDGQLRKKLFSMIKEIESNGTDARIGCFKKLGTSNNFSLRLNGKSGPRAIFVKKSETEIVLYLEMCDVAKHEHGYESYY